MAWQGKRVLITCSAAGVAETMARLRAAGATPISIPLVEVREPSDGYAALDAAIARMDSYAWIVFTSKNAVASFVSRLSSRLGERGIPRTVRFAAVGPGTAAALGKQGIAVAAVAHEHHAEGLLDVLMPHLTEGDRVLWPRARDARETLARGLRERGIQVDGIEAYRSEIPVGIDRAALIDIVERREVDAVLFDSASAVRHFVEIVGEPRAKAFAQEAEYIPIGPITAQTIRGRFPLRNCRI